MQAMATQQIAHEKMQQVRARPQQLRYSSACNSGAKSRAAMRLSEEGDPVRGETPQLILVHPALLNAATARHAKWIMLVGMW